MCHGATEHSCVKSVFAFESLTSSLPWNPLPVPVVDRLRGRKIEPQTEDLTRVLFIPKHNSTVTHLPIYELRDAYSKAVEDVAPGSDMFKINMLFMDRPKGDGTNADVRFFVNVDGEKNIATIEERSMISNWGAATTIILPTEQGERTILRTSGIDRLYIRAIPNPRSEIQANDTKPADKNLQSYPTLIVECAENAEAQLVLRPNDHGCLCYHLSERKAEGTRETNNPQLKAIYQHAGPHIYHPLDYSEGVLLLPEAHGSKDDGIAIGLAYILLWHIRGLEVPQEKLSLTKIFGKLGIGKKPGTK